MKFKKIIIILSLFLLVFSCKNVSASKKNNSSKGSNSSGIGKPSYVCDTSATTKNVNSNGYAQVKDISPAEFDKLPEASYNVEGAFKILPADRIRSYDKNGEVLKVSINIPSKKKVYFTLLNLNEQDSSGLSISKIKGGIDDISPSPLRTEVPLAGPRTMFFQNRYQGLGVPRPKMICDVNKVGDSCNFTYPGYAGNPPTDYKFKLVYKTDEIQTAFGPKQVEVLFENYSYSTKSENDYTAIFKTQVEKFLKAGLNNDIFDRETAIFGDDQSPEVEGLNQFDKKLIRIYFADIDHDYTPGGVIAAGLFDLGITSDTGIFSFFIDLPGMDGRDLTVTDGVIVHEFQHMLQFGQRITEYERWNNEALSMAAMDIMSDKYNFFNSSFRKEYLTGFEYYPGTPYRPWILSGVDLPNYYSASGFFAYVLRNFGGADFIKAIDMGGKNSFTSFKGPAENQEAPINLGLAGMGYNCESYATVMRKLGPSVLLSGLKDNPPTIGFPSQSSTVNGEEFKLNELVFDIAQNKSIKTLKKIGTSFSIKPYETIFIDPEVLTSPGSDLVFKAIVPSGVYLSTVFR